MADRDPFKERERGLEEEYFLRKERELVEKMRQRQEADRQRGELAERVGTSNEEILRALQDLGYNAETVKLIHLMPLIQVAWADGRVDSKERAKLIEVARSSQIEEGSEADQMLARWLDKRPSEEVVEAHLLAINAIMQAVPEEARQQMKENLINYSITLASASRGLLGLESRISRSEREAIERIVSEVAPEQSESVKERLSR